MTTVGHDGGYKEFPFTYHVILSILMTQNMLF